MENYKDLLGRAEALFNEAKGIVENAEATTEDWERVEPLMQEAKGLQAKAAQLRDVFEWGSQLAAEKEAERQGREAKAHEDATPSRFKDWTEFLVASYAAQHPNPEFRRADARLKYFEDKETGGHEGKQLVENVGASGGFLVPAEFMAQLQAVAAENAIVRPRATIIRMRRRQIDIPVLDQTGTTSSQAHWFGGMLCYWAEEATEKTITTASFRKVSLVAHKLIMYTRSSDELMADSAVSLSDFLAGPLGFAGAVSWQEDYSFINGTGAGQPLGVILAGATITVNRAAGGAIGYADLVNMYESFLPSGRGVWLFSQSAVSNLLTLQDAAGNYIWLPNMQHTAGSPPGTLFGLPVIFTEKCPRVGTAGDVILADWRYYLLGDRQATTVESTQYDYWRYDQTSWRAVHRVDGQPWLSAPLTYQDGTTQVSPFVILGNKST
jgi:HK97 family phage major capsid protein